MKRFFVSIVSLSLFSSFLVAQNDATIKEVKRKMKTYRFYDPDPVANPFSGYYPYFRFDGYAAKAVDKAWNFVEMENDFIKVTIAPEIGGKVWGAIEKSTKNAFLYYNHVVKFRDISMRGPWTSGGVEFNFGLIGHVPTTATPVDYHIRKNRDGSVSCFVGALELLTHTTWTVEINLPKDKAYFTTRTFWSNGSGVGQPFYHWSNAAYHDGNDMQLIFPGHAYIGHGGDTHPFPVDAHERDLSWYKNNNFGDSKSYHVLGSYCDFYGAYWHEKGYGSAHYAPYDEKLGKKIFIWGLSESGMIWKNLLTDDDGQYVELQSGKMFNQPGTSSAFTPFKHPEFAPFGTEEWKEYWFPVTGTGGITKAHPSGTLHLAKQHGKLHLSFSPLERTEKEISVFQDDREVYRDRMDLQVLQRWEKRIALPSEEKPLKVVIGKNEWAYDEKEDLYALERPLSLPEEFDWNSAYALYVKGTQCLNQKRETDAEKLLLQCLEKDPLFLPALNKMALLYHRWGRYAASLDYCKQALRLDTYQGETNYLYALNQMKLGKLTDAKEGFSIASYSVGEKSAAFFGLAQCFFLEDDAKKTEHYLRKSLENNARNIFSKELLLCLYRISGQTEQALKAAEELLQENPLNHLVKFEKYLLSGEEADLSAFRNGITNELSFETYLELSEWYVSLSRHSEAIRLLKYAPENPLVYYHLSWLLHKEGDRNGAEAFLDKAESLSPELIFPHRVGTLACLEWAQMVRSSWKNNYYRSLLYATMGNRAKATALLKQCDNSDFAPLYLFRSQMQDKEKDKLADLLKAEELNPNDWRTGMAFISFYQNRNRKKEALAYAEKYFAQDPENYRIGLRYAKLLSDNERYDKSLSILSALEVLPNEGAYEGRVVYRNAHLKKSIDCLKKRQYARALKHVEASMIWPENLGVGKPYEENIDNHFEHFLQGVIHEKMHNRKQAERCFDRVVGQTSFLSQSNILLTALSLRKTGKRDEANKMMQAWKEKEPDSYIRQWSTELFEGRKGNHEQTFRMSDIDAQVKPWEQADRNDGNFSLVSALADCLE